LTVDAGQGTYAPAMAHAKGSRRVVGALLVCSLLVACVVLPRSARASGGERRAVTVLVPDARDLRFLAFWVALGSGSFAREGLDVNVIAASSPAAARTTFMTGPAPVALLLGPDYERLVSDRFPFVLAANLLQNDPTELVLRRDVVNRLQINERMPVAQRLSLLRGITIGVAVPDRGHLYQLFRSQGSDADIAQMSVRKGEGQVAALEAGEIDAAYVATPFVEQALDHDAVVVVDAAAGEIPAFSERMLAALAVTSAFATARAADVQALVRGIAKAEHVIHFEPGAATQAILRAVPSVTPPHAARLVALYARAVPATPHVEAQLITRESAFYPVGADVLNLKGVDLQSYVLASQPAVAGGGTRTSAPASASTGTSHNVPALLGVFALLIALLVVIADQREGARDASKDEVA
jgi:ABC-type nitrate/sulfonate/bicarbonate transport system substrate-binding protein